MRKFLWIASAILLYLSACTKIESTNIGAGLIPPVDGVNTFDTFLDVTLANGIDTPGQRNSIVYKTDDHVIGVINDDPLFGTTRATAYMELKPLFYSFNANFPEGSNRAIDSIVLVLSYRGIIGDSTISQQWEIEELSNVFGFRDTNYNVNTQLLGLNSITTLTVRPKFFPLQHKDAFETATNQVRLRLPNSFGAKYLDSLAYRNDTTYKEKLGGFSIGPTAGSPGNALIRVNLLDSNTKLAVYYRYIPKDSSRIKHSVQYLRFNFPGSFNNFVSGSGNYIQRNYNGSQLVNNLGGSTNDSIAYIQTNPGTFANLKIPGLKDLGNSIIHRAELTMVDISELPSPKSVFNTPYFLLLSRYDEVNKFKRNVPNDFVISSGQPNFATFGGYRFQRNVDNGIRTAYVFDLSRFVQGIVTRKDSAHTLHLSAPVVDSLSYTSPYPFSQPGKYYITPSIANNIADGRTKLAGGYENGRPVRMRLRIIYSRL